MSGPSGLCASLFRQFEIQIGVYSMQRAAFVLNRHDGCTVEELHEILSDGGTPGSLVAHVEACLDMFMPLECAVFEHAQRMIRSTFRDDLMTLYVRDGVEISEKLLELSKAPVDIEADRARRFWAAWGCVCPFSRCGQEESSASDLDTFCNVITCQISQTLFALGHAMQTLTSKFVQFGPRCGNFMLCVEI